MKVAQISPNSNLAASSASPDRSGREWMQWEASVIGSADGVSLKLPSALVEPLHCSVMRVAGGYELWDLNSRGGTFLNDVRIVRAALAHGDRIRVGPYVLRFVEGPAARRRREAARREAVASARPASADGRPTLKLRGEPKPADPKGGSIADNSGLVDTLDHPMPELDGIDRPETEIDRLRRQVAQQERLLGLAAEKLRAQENRIANQSNRFLDLEKQFEQLSHTFHGTPALDAGGMPLPSK